MKKFLATCGIKIAAHAPEILTVAGVGLMVTGGVMAVKATKKLDTNLQAVKEERGIIESCWDKVKDTNGCEDYTREDYEKDCMINTGHRNLAYVKAFGIPVALAVTGAVSIFVGHKILRGRWLAACASFDALSESFSLYRNHIKEQYGEEADIVGMTGAPKSEAKKVTTTEEGNKTVKVSTYDKSIYLIPFDSSNPNWTPSPDSNFFFLNAVQKHMNERLRWNGYVFLADVWEAMGYEPEDKSLISMAHQVGWRSKENGGTDGYIKLLPDIDTIVSTNDCILLNPNVDGYLLDKF